MGITINSLAHFEINWPILIKRKKNWNHSNDNNGDGNNGKSNNNYLLILLINFAIQHQSKLIGKRKEGKWQKTATA